MTDALGGAAPNRAFMAGSGMLSRGATLKSAWHGQRSPLASFTDAPTFPRPVLPGAGSTPQGAREPDGGSAMSNVLTFPGNRPASSVRMLNPTPEGHEARTTRRQIASRKRNPLRHHYSRIASAVTIAGKLHRGEALRADPVFDDRECLRAGADAARILADELARISPRNGRINEQCCRARRGVNVEQLHAQAFRELETSLRDCVRMTGIAAELMLNAAVENDHLRFAVFHSAELLMRLKRSTTSELRGPS